MIRLTRTLTWWLYKHTGLCLHLGWVGEVGNFEGDRNRCFCCDSESSGEAWLNRC
jgi:hypothetical protein